MVDLSVLSGMSGFFVFLGDARPLSPSQSNHQRSAEHADVAVTAKPARTIYQACCSNTTNAQPQALVGAEIPVK